MIAFIAAVNISAIIAYADIAVFQFHCAAYAIIRSLMYTPPLPMLAIAAKWSAAQPPYMPQNGRYVALPCLPHYTPPPLIFIQRCHTMRCFSLPLPLYLFEFIVDIAADAMLFDYVTP